MAIERLKRCGPHFIGHLCAERLARPRAHGTVPRPPFMSPPLLPPSAAPSVESGESAESKPSSLRRFLGYVWPYSGLIARATACGMLKFVLPSTMALSFRFLTD